MQQLYLYTGLLYIELYTHNIGEKICKYDFNNQFAHNFTESIKMKSKACILSHGLLFKCMN